jgi:hypothetical protein
MMMNPLKECSSIGIKLFDFNAQFKATAPKKGSLAEGDEEDSDSSSNSSSSTSDSDSDTSSSSSSSSSSSESNSDSDSDSDGDGVGGGVSKLSMSTTSKLRGSKAAAAADSQRDEEREAKLRHQTQFTNWLRTQGLILEQDTIASALEVMSQFKTTKAFVVNSFGEVVGVVSIRSIAIEILKYEGKTQKENYLLAVDEDKDDD